MSLFFANKGFHPQLSITPTSEACNQDAMEISGEMTQILEQLQAELQLSQEAQAHAANLHQVLSPSYQTGDLVWLNTKNIRTHRPCKKLDDKWIRLFKVLKTIRSCACHLELPHTLKIHPVFCHSSGPVALLAQVTHRAGKFHLHCCLFAPPYPLPIRTSPAPPASSLLLFFFPSLSFVLYINPSLKSQAKSGQGY